MTARTLFRDFPPEAFPLTIELLDAATGEALWKATADGPGIMDIPTPADLGIARVSARVTFADGTVSESR